MDGWGLSEMVDLFRLDKIILINYSLQHFSKLAALSIVRRYVTSVLHQYRVSELYLYVCPHVDSSARALSLPACLHRSIYQSITDLSVRLSIDRSLSMYTTGPGILRAALRSRRHHVCADADAVCIVEAIRRSMVHIRARCFHPASYLQGAQGVEARKYPMLYTFSEKKYSRHVVRSR